MSRFARIMSVFMAVMFVLGFGLATTLEPDSRGYGTHQQLGLPPCNFKSLLGIGCPHCGMTTSFSNLVRGRFEMAFQANPVGPVLAAFCAIAIPWLLFMAWRGRWVGIRNPEKFFLTAFLGYLGLSIVIWVFRELPQL